MLEYWTLSFGKGVLLDVFSRIISNGEEWTSDGYRAWVSTLVPTIHVQWQKVHTIYMYRAYLTIITCNSSVTCWYRTQGLALMNTTTSKWWNGHRRVCSLETRIQKLIVNAKTVSKDDSSTIVAWWAAGRICMQCSCVLITGKKVINWSLELVTSTWYNKHLSSRWKVRSTVSSWSCGCNPPWACWANLLWLWIMEFSHSALAFYWPVMQGILCY